MLRGIPAIVVLCFGVGPLFAADTLVLCPNAWRPELHGWAEMRQAQGHTLSIVDAADTVEGNQQLIHQANADGGLRCVVLIGNAGIIDAPPCGYEPAPILRRWGPDKSVATDHVYANLDGDAAPEVAIGRIPCRTAQELRAYLHRVVAHETTARENRFSDRLSLVASPGNFSPWLDRVLEATATRVFTELTPPSISLDVVYASPASPHFPGPDRLHAAVLASYRRPALAWVYLGHGLPDRVDHAPSPTGVRPLLDTTLARQAGGEASPPLACLFACYTGAFDAKKPCLAEAMLARPNGPLAVIAASRVTMPYGNSLLGIGLMEAIFEESVDPGRGVGAVFLQAEARLLGNDSDPAHPELRDAIESIAAGLASKADRRQELIEHVQAYHLLGDPLLSIKPTNTTAPHDQTSQKTSTPQTKRLRGAVY